MLSELTAKAPTRAWWQRDLAVSHGKAGLDPRRDLQIVEVTFPNIAPAIREGRVDCGVLVIPFMPAEAAKGDLRGLFTGGDTLGPSSVVFQVATNKFALLPDPNPSGIQMGGFQQLVRGEAMRGKFRNSYEKPEPLVPNKPTEWNVPLRDHDHVFLKGHRIMVQIQSTWFPVNMQISRRSRSTPYMSRLSA